MAFKIVLRLVFMFATRSTCRNAAMTARSRGSVVAAEADLEEAQEGVILVEAIPEEAIPEEGVVEKGEILRPSELSGEREL